VIGVTQRVPLLDEILVSPDLVSVFQPIYRLGEELTVHGHEALSRLEIDSPIARLDLLFEYASRKKRSVELNLACAARAMKYGHPLTSQGLLFINIDPRVLARPDSAAKVREMAGQEGIALDRIVLEITEQSAIGDTTISMKTVAELREAGVQFALDDVGIAYSHLPLIGEIQPRYLKISQEFGTGFETDPTREKIIRNILGLAREFGCLLILEGIETAETGAAATRLGIEFGQGYHYARPAKASTFERSSN
jgi:EAL domain-containing protein (putative c-di-GMP-specific phosphodiesterase class I)